MVDDTHSGILPKYVIKWHPAGNFLGLGSRRVRLVREVIWSKLLTFPDVAGKSVLDVVGHGTDTTHFGGKDGRSVY